ncbi:MAG TPA: hypothetical protein VFK02_09625, partial [Kofleriaceae bacterium]|nr:hypothetical protein [Kofleriaceae bacterium]
MTRLLAAIAAIATGVPAIALADDLPAMDPEQPVLCVRDTQGLVWRIQCNAHAKLCLYAPDAELDAGGQRRKPLERARGCELDAPFDRSALEAQGFRFVAARVDAPWGWMRDERARVYQVSFDLRRRMYFGAAYTPVKVLDNPLASKRTSIDFGLLVLERVRGGRTPTRHRLRLVEGQVHIEPFSAELVAAHYDVSRRFFDPLLRVTTFVGTPSRHDLYLNVGLWSEAGGLELHRTAMGNTQLWRHATAQVTLDLWQSPSLDSYLRVRTGLGLEGQHDEVNGYRSALTGTSALDLDMVLDPHGFHNLRIEIDHEVPRYTEPITARGRWAQRMRARVQYEAIVLAINDQPLSVKLAAGGEKRDDLPGVPDQWAFVIDAGLRFSLWAPP